MVSTQIRDRRIAAGLTQEELAARARCASSTIRNIEAGRVSRPEHTTIDAIGEALGLSPDEPSSRLGASLAPSTRRSTPSARPSG
jgi:transcriptional regulator with XRE-family HTH domain